MSASWIDGNFYFEVADKKDKYLKMELDNFYKGLTAISDGGSIPGVWTIALCDSDSMDDWISSFTMGLPGTEIVGVTASKDDEGNEVDVINLKSMMGTIDITVSKDSVVNSGVITVSQPGMPAMKITAVSSLKFLDKAPVITFDAGEKEMFETVEAMFDIEEGDDAPEEKSLDGKVAPDFTLARMDGSGDVTLSSLKGEVVVLDFWATWCGPCKKGLPSLNEFDAWVQEQGLNVKVFAVNVWERGDDAKVKETVQAFWKKNKYKTAVLMASGSDSLTKQYGVSGIPVTFIIDTKGNIVESHVGYSPDTLEILKKSVSELLSEKSLTKEPDHPDHPDHPN
jgi:thiol-disulfide isomerase/thioredoxin